MLPNFIRVDIEPTNRCNADCYFCPRDKTPDEGLLKPEVFDAALRRVLELEQAAGELMDFPVGVTLCGLGEPLINKHTPDFVARIRDAGLYCTLSSNGSLLDEQRGRALLDAGLQAIHLNVGERDAGYEEIYKVPWERTRDNVLRFSEMAGDSCDVEIVLVNHRRDVEHIRGMVDYWKEQGITRFLPFEIMNRGGSLVVEELTYGPEITRRATDMFDGDAPPCVAPFVFPFVGYDGQIYLCCSDWTKTAPFGSVFDTSFVDAVTAKFDHVTRRAGICATCNIEPVHRVADALRAHDEGDRTAEEVDGLVEELRRQGELAERFVSTMGPLASPTKRRLIPVRSS